MQPANSSEATIATLNRAGTRSARRSLLLLTMATIVLLWMVGRFLPAYVPLPADTASLLFPAEATAWQGAEPTESFVGGITVRSHRDEVNKLFFEFSRPASLVDGAHLRVSAVITVDAEPADPAATAALAIWFLDNKGEKFGYRNIYFMPGRSHKPHAAGVFDWPPAASRGVVGLLSRPGAATFTVHNGQIDVVRRNAAYTPTLAVLAAICLLWFASVARFAWRRIPAAGLWWPGMALMAIIAGVMSSSPLLRQLILPVVSGLSTLLPVTPITATAILYKLGHALLFAVFTGLLLRLRRHLRVSTMDIGLFVLLLAAITECLQLFLPNRDAAVVDVVIDAAGIAVAMLLAWMWGKIPVFR